MPILDNQYETLDVPQQRAEFRAELLKLTDYGRGDLLKKQSQASLTKLKSSVESILSQVISEDVRNKFTMLLNTTTLALSKKLQDVPVAYDVMLSHLNSPEKSLFKIDPKEGEPYFTLVFPRVLNAAIKDKDVLGQYEYSDEELQRHAARQDRIHIKKTSIQGIEGLVDSKIQNAILKQKSEIIGELRSKVLEQQGRCQSDDRQNDPKLQALSEQATRQLETLDAILHDDRANLVGILSVIDSTSTFAGTVDNAVDQFKQDASKKQDEQAYKTTLLQVVERSLSHTQRPKHDYSQYEINNVLIINPGDKSESFLALSIHSESKTINAIIKEVYGACQSRDPKAHVMGRKDNMMFIDKALLQKNESLSQQIKERIFSQKEQIVAELKESVTRSMDRCASDLDRQSSPELTLLKQQGENIQSKLDILNSPEQLMQVIDETENYRSKVSEAIKAFKALVSAHPLQNSSVQLVAPASTATSFPKLSEEQHKTKVTVDIQFIINAYKERFTDRTVEKNEKGETLLAFRDKDEVNVFFTDVAKKGNTPFFATEVGKDNHFYSCGDGKLHTGNMKEIHQSLRNSLRALKDNSQDNQEKRRLIEKGIAFIESKILSTSPAAAYKTELVDMKDTAKAAETPDHKTPSRGL